ncbi:MAG TPA: GNAT family N-acetyltransferase [Myxococcaceae bacterium]
MTDAELAARLRANLVAWKQFQTERGTLRALTQPGAWAFAIPDQPDRVHPQQVLYTDSGALRAALPAIEDFYRGLGVRFWRVLVPPGDSATEQLLDGAGYVPRDRQPAMGFHLAGARLEAPRLKLEPLETMRELVLLNEEVAGPGVRIPIQPWHAAPQATLHVLGVRENGRLLSGGMAFDAGDTVGIYLMATALSVRGRGLASDVMRGMLLEAQARGRTAAVLQTTPLGHRVYQRIGFRDLETWTSWAHLAG